MVQLYRSFALDSVHAHAQMFKPTSMRECDRTVNHLQQTATLPLPAIQACDLRPFDL